MADVSVVQMLEAARDDLGWYEEHTDDLKSRYNNKFIAFQHKEVLDSDSSLDILLHRLRENHVDTSNIIIRFMSKVKMIL